MRKDALLLSAVLSTGTLGLTLAAAPSVLVPSAWAQQTATRSDLAVESDVLHQLANTSGLNGQQVSASTEKGVVTLTGNVPDQATRALAESATAGVQGVRSVVNSLAVNGVAQPAATSEGAKAPGNDPSPAEDAATVAAAVEPEDGASGTPQGPPAAAAQAPQSARSKPDPRVPDPNGANQPQATQPPPAATPQPQPGAPGDWGPAGPPPDAQDGRIPPPPSADQQSPNQSTPPAADGQTQYPNRTSPPPASSGSYPPAAGRQSYPRPPYTGGSAQQGNAPVGYGRSAPPNRAPAAPLTIPTGTMLTVRISEPLDSRRLQEGDMFEAMAAQDIFENGTLAIPRGASLEGHVVGVKKAGVLRGSAGFALQLTAINLSGQSYPVMTDTFATDTAGKGGYTAANAVSGAAIGAIIGAIAGRGEGAAIGAVAGGATGAGVSAATPSPREVMPPETMLRFHLKEPVTLRPVSYQEAERLAASVAQRQPPSLRPRRYGYPPPPPYGYPR